ncbi:ankyrin repeat domain-containing protein [archaeon]|nr:MAG: ankyrin repeat domain-containing protein [archaeon]
MADNAKFLELLNLLKSAYPKFDEVKRLVSENEEMIRYRRSTDGATPLHVACYNSTILLIPDLIKFLVSSHPESLFAVNTFRQTPVHKALLVATSIHLESVEFLLKSVVDAPLAITKDGQNLLHSSLSQSKDSSEDIVSLLVDLFPLLVELPDKYAQYPIHLAANKKKTNINIIRKLVDDVPTSLLWKDSKG